MNIEENQKVSSLESLISSIEIDNQVYQWFLLLITQPQVISELTSSEQATQSYAKLKKTFVQKRGLLAAILFLSLILVALKSYYFLLGVACLLYPLWKLSQSQKKYVLTISTYLLEHNFDPETLPTKTLYQITEILSRKHEIPSLVDAIYTQDNISRKTIIFTFVFTSWIYPLANLWAVFLCVIIAYFTIQTFMNTSFFYNNLKITVFEKDNK